MQADLDEVDAGEGDHDVPGQHHADPQQAVEQADGEAFINEVRAQAARYPALVVDVGGPWPPYSFAMLEQR